VCILMNFKAQFISNMPHMYTSAEKGSAVLRQNIFLMIFGIQGDCFPQQDQPAGLKAAVKLVYSKLILFM
jgi:hypothetical protein